MSGRSLLEVVALVLLGAGVFCIAQAATGHFLPHDTAYLGMTAKQLCTLQQCRIVHFMIHDRVSFGGVLVATAIVYLWLARVPLRAGETWAWWAFAASGSLGFLGFLSYLGQGYLDAWHGAATLGLLPIYVAGMWLTRELRRVAAPRPPLGAGRALLALACFGVLAAGATITGVGMTAVFVPQDLEFMGLARADLEAVNPRLVPLIAHDRAGFGGALVACGAAMLLAALRGRASPSLRRAMGAAGLIGFGCAIGIHPLIGYTSFTHLAPAVLGALIYAVGVALLRDAAPGAAAGAPGAHPGSEAASAGPSRAS